MTLGLKWFVSVLSVILLSSVPHVYSIYQHGWYVSHQWVTAGATAVALGALGEFGF